MVAHKRLQQCIKSILEEHQLNMTQWLIISKLSQIHKGLRTTDLARFMHVEVPLVTMMSRPLRRRGLIKAEVRTPDRREKLLSTTDEAEQIITDVEKRLQQQFATLLDDVSSHDVQAYFKVLHNMAGSSA